RSVRPRARHGGGGVTWPARELLPQHAELIKESAISEEVATERGYFSVSRPKDLEGMFPKSQQRAPALVIPLHDVSGERFSFQLRPDNPRVGRDGRVLKYEARAGLRMALDVPRSARRHLRNPKVPLWITEGSRKVDSLASAGLCG